MRITSVNIRRSLLATGLLIAAGPALAQATSQGSVPGAADRGTTSVQPAPSATPRAAVTPAAPQGTATTPARPQGSAAAPAPSGQVGQTATGQAVKPATPDRHGSAVPAAPATSGGPARAN